MPNQDKNADPIDPYAIFIMKLMLVMASIFSGAIALTLLSYVGNVKWLSWASTLSWISGLSIPALGISLVVLAFVSGRNGNRN